MRTLRVRASLRTPMAMREPDTDSKVSVRAPSERAVVATAESTPLLFQLWSVQFQQLSWLGAAGAGGVLALVQAGFLSERIGATVSMAAFALAALVSVLGPMVLVDGVATGRDVRRGVRAYLIAAILLVGIGIGGLLTGGVLQLLGRR